MLKNIRDAMGKGDTNGSSISKQVILPANFTIGPRYLFQNYQDAMAICRNYGYPTLFITFICNSKWPKIQEALNLTLGQQAEDRPDIVLECSGSK